VITAIDTNVLLDVFGADSKFGPGSSEALRRCLREGALVASEVVWAETATVFGDAARFRDAMHKLQAAFSGKSTPLQAMQNVEKGLKTLNP